MVFMMDPYMCPDKGTARRGARVPGIVAGGRARQAASWVPRGETQSLQLRLTPGRYRTAAVSLQLTLQMTLKGAGCLCWEVGGETETTII